MDQQNDKVAHLQVVPRNTTTTRGTQLGVDLDRIQPDLVVVVAVKGADLRILMPEGQDVFMAKGALAMAGEMLTELYMNDAIHDSEG